MTRLPITRRPKPHQAFLWLLVPLALAAALLGLDIGDKVWEALDALRQSWIPQCTWGGCRWSALRQALRDLPLACQPWQGWRRCVRRDVEPTARRRRDA